MDVGEALSSSKHLNITPNGQQAYIHKEVGIPSQSTPSFSLEMRHAKILNIAITNTLSILGHRIYESELFCLSTEIILGNKLGNAISCTFRTYFCLQDSRVGYPASSVTGTIKDQGSSGITIFDFVKLSQICAQESYHSYVSVLAVYDASQI